MAEAHFLRKARALWRFRSWSLAEGWSYLLLLFVAMPLKYGANWPLGVQVAGWIHGALFVIYLILGLYTAIFLRWKLARVASAVLAALLPFGPFVLDRVLKREEKELRAST